MDVSTLTVGILAITVGLRVALVLGFVWVLIPRRARCPHCRSPAERIVVPRPLVMMRVERRWCMQCGWEGWSKRFRRAQSVIQREQDRAVSREP